MLPPRERMLEAFMSRDPAFDGVFFTGVSTTGIFCRTTCAARKPRSQNVRFFAWARDALAAGYRPCMRCRPLVPAGAPPPWLETLISEVEANPDRRWTDADLRDRGVEPSRARRWFRKHHGMTFHDYARTRRLAGALGAIKSGADVARTAYASGYDSLSGFNAAFKGALGRPPTEARRSPTVTVDRIPTPLGPMVAAANQTGLALLEFADRRMLETQLTQLRSRLADAVVVRGPNEHIRSISQELDEYFAGQRLHFDTPLVISGTPFQETVWRALLEIPAGETRSYGQVAEAIGRPNAVRAVARANGDNRLAIVIPCHRVIGADGRLTGYGGGLWRKQRLLELEVQPALGL